MERAAFLARLSRAAARRGSGATASPPPPPATAQRSWQPPATTSHNAERQLDLFAARLQELGVTLRRVDGLEAVRADVDEICAARGWHTVACDPELRLPDLAARRVDDPREAEFGLSIAVAGITETGSVVMRSGAGHPRSISLLPPATGFVLREEDVTADLGDVLRRLDADDASLPACVTFVSGPSNTADIAGQLVVGAHGPAEVFVWLVAGSTPAADE